MDNVLKETIRKEIEKYNKEKGEGSESESIPPVDTSPANPKEKMKSKAHTPQTERRLSKLLEKIRSKSYIRAKSSSKKTKKLQVKYERFDPMLKTYKLVREKDGGIPRFIDVYTEDKILFKDNRAKAEKLFLIVCMYVCKIYLTSVCPSTSVLSSAKLWIEEDSMKKKRSLIEKSNRSGPTIEPCGTPVIDIFKVAVCVVYTDTLFSIL